MNENMTVADIAEYLGVSRRHVVERVTKAVGFPRPVVHLSRKTKQWAAEEIRAYAAAPKSLRPILGVTEHG